MSRSHTSLFSLRPGLTSACLALALGTGGLLAVLPAHAQTLTVGQIDPNTGAPLGDGSATISNGGTSASGSYQFQATNGDPTLDPATSTYDAVNVYTPNSTLTVSGGTIGSLVNLGTSTVSGGTVSSLTNYTGISNISGGTVNDLSSFGGTAHVSGGAVGAIANYAGSLTVTGGGGIVELDNYSTAHVSGVAVGNIINYAGSLTVTGGGIGELDNYSNLAISGGTIDREYNQGGQINLSGGSVSILGSSDSTTTITGGTVGDFSTNGTSTASISDGAVTSSVNAQDNSVVTISGGTFGTIAGPGELNPAGTFVPVDFKTSDSAILDLLGNNLTESLINPNGTYTITGTLLNSTSPFTAVFSDYTTGGNGLEFNGVAAAPVPELSSATQMMLLLCLSALALVKLRKKKPVSAHPEPGSTTALSEYSANTHGHHYLLS